jgi:hypothetical protein
MLAGMPQAAAEECAGPAAPPSDLATPSMLYETLSSRTNAELLAIGFIRKPVERTCTWVYEVKMLTASGSVVRLTSMPMADLDCARADNDRDAADLSRRSAVTPVFRPPERPRTILAAVPASQQRQRQRQQRRQRQWRRRSRRR